MLFPVKEKDVGSSPTLGIDGDAGENPVTNFGSCSLNTKARRCFGIIFLDKTFS